ncbi:MAG: hypothetical protein ACJ75H_24255 [Thermoanaerobaculia bacterium]
MSLRSLRQGGGIFLEGRSQADAIRRALICLWLGGGCLAFERMLDGSGVSDTRILVARFSGFLGWSFLVASTLLLLRWRGHPADLGLGAETTGLPQPGPEKYILPVLGTSAERSRRIDELYAELRPLMNRVAVEPGLRDEIQAKLSVLRQLQTEEAEEMERRYNASSLLKPGEGLKALERARELLSRYENTPSPDTTSLNKA